MNEATKLINEFEDKGKPTVGTSAAGALPIVGDVLERNLMTPEQQQYKNAALAWIRAKLRKESGAAIGIDEAEQEYKIYSLLLATLLRLLNKSKIYATRPCER